MEIDIGLIILDVGFTLDSNAVNPICLPISELVMNIVFFETIVNFSFIVLSKPINLKKETFFLVGRGVTSPASIPSMYLQSAQVKKYDLGKFTN